MKSPNDEAVVFPRSLRLSPKATRPEKPWLYAGWQHIPMTAAIMVNIRFWFIL
jgi:hypothetical protein